MRPILLVNPCTLLEQKPIYSSVWPPIGLACLAATIRTHGLPVAVCDLNFAAPGTLGGIVQELEPALIGISCMSSNFPAGLSVAHEVRTLTDSPIVMGGVHPTIEPWATLQHELVDYVVIGEGELPLVELYRWITGSGNRLPSIPGLGYIEDGQPVLTPRPPLIDLAEAPFPAYDLLPIPQYIADSDRNFPFRSLGIITSRGCPFACAFCAVHRTMGRRWRAYPPDRTVSWIRQLLNTYNVDRIWFKDSTFTINRKWVEALCQEVKSASLDFRWVISTRVDCVDRPLLRTMRDAGLETVLFGVESGSDLILRVIRKGTTTADTHRAFRLCQQLGIKTGAYFMVGLPEETLDDIRASFQLAVELQPDYIHWHVFYPLPGSELYDRVVGEAPYDLNEIRYDRAYGPTGPLSAEGVNDIYESICAYFYHSGPSPF